MKKPIFLMIAAIMFFSFNLEGQTWSTPKRLTWNSGSSRWPSIAADSGNGIHVVWTDNSSGNEEIYYKRSTNSGSTWSTPTRLTWNSGWSLYPTIAADSGSGIHVVWYDNSPGNAEVFYKHSTDGGATWSNLQRLTWKSYDSKCVRIAVDSSDRIHVAWYNDSPGPRDLFYKNSTDSGNTWSALKRLTWSTKLCPSIAADSGNGIHIAADGGNDIYYKHSTDNGATWPGLIRLTWSPRSDSPAIATGTGNWIHVVWNEIMGSFPYESPMIYYKRSSDYGASWSPIKILRSNHSEMPAITTDRVNGVHVVWKDYYPPGDFDILYKYSTDSGINWSVITRLTWNTGESEDPSIACDLSENIHLVWMDNTPGNYEIFYKFRKFAKMMNQ